ncbi:MAG: glutaredoxin family protein [Chromatiales bacterium]|nr:glutaredoxin family protein [Chromatiales bacterium]
MSQVTLKLYYRSGCGLCEAMQAELFRAQPQYGFQLELVDVDGREALIAAYGHMVPVLTTEHGEEICHYFLDHDALAGYFSSE